jgi:predicted nuclease with TOPRIM domain
LLQSASHAAQLFVYGDIIMETMREAWTDERLDDLTNRMDRGFDRLDARFEKFESRMEARFDRIDDRFERIDERFERVDERFERVDARFERFEARMTSRFEWLWRLMLASYVTALIGYFAAHS